MKGYRQIVEEKIGRGLDSKEHVHHINGDHNDNRIENLRIVSPSEHRQIHWQMEQDEWERTHQRELAMLTRLIDDIYEETIQPFIGD
jgi:hypothetical protein